MGVCKRINEKERDSNKNFQKQGRESEDEVFQRKLTEERGREESKCVGNRCGAGTGRKAQKTRPMTLAKPGFMWMTQQAPRPAQVVYLNRGIYLVQCG